MFPIKFKKKQQKSQKNINNVFKMFSNLQFSFSEIVIPRNQQLGLMRIRFATLFRIRNTCKNFKWFIKPQLDHSLYRDLAPWKISWLVLLSNLKYRLYR
jgi:hypothetical protein